MFLGSHNRLMGSQTVCIHNQLISRNAVFCTRTKYHPQSLGGCSINRDLIVSSWKISFVNDFEPVSNPGVDMPSETVHPSKKSSDFRLRESGFEFQLTPYVTLGKLLNLCVSLPHLKKDNKTYLSGLLSGLNVLMYIEHLAHFSRT